MCARGVGKVIAFEQGWCAKQVYHSYKIAYSASFARFSPGQLLIYLLLNQFSNSREVTAIDFLGPLDEAVQRWHPQTYRQGRLLMAPPSPLARMLVSASRCVRPRSAWRGAGNQTEQLCAST